MLLTSVAGRSTSVICSTSFLLLCKLPAILLHVVGLLLCRLHTVSLPTAIVVLLHASLCSMCPRELRLSVLTLVEVCMREVREIANLLLASNSHHMLKNKLHAWCQNALA